MSERVYLNGRLAASLKASVSVFDRGLNYGDGLFETIRAVDGVPQLFDEHIKRLKAGLKALKINGSHIDAFLKDGKGVVDKLLKTNGLLHGPAYIRVTITRGPDRSGHLPGDSVPTVIVVTKPLDTERLKRQRHKGIKAVLLKGFSPSLPSVKTLNYLPNVLGKFEAGGRGAAEGIFTVDGVILEGTSTNVFIVKNGIIKTPEAGGSVLPGVTRAAVLRLAKKNGIKAIETKVKEKELYACDEAFLTNSIIGAVPLVRIEKKPISGGKIGPVTRLIQDALKPVTG